MGYVVAVPYACVLIASCWLERTQVVSPNPALHYSFGSLPSLACSMKIVYLIIVFVLTAYAQANAQEVLTNGSVIALNTAKVSRKLIEEKINRSTTRFDVSINGLLALKTAKVPEPLVELMLSLTQSTDIIQNKDIIELHRAGYGRKLIVQKIQASRSAFDTSTDGMIELKTAKLPDALIEAMMVGGAPQSAPSAKPVVASAKTDTPASSTKAATKSPTQTTPFKDPLYANQSSKEAAARTKTSDGKTVLPTQCNAWFDKFTKKNVKASQATLRGSKLGAKIIVGVLTGGNPGDVGIEDLEVDLIFRRDGSDLSLVLYARKPGLNLLVVDSDKPLMFLMQDESVMQFMPAENSESSFDWGGGGSYETDLLMYYKLTPQQAQTLSKKLIKGYRLNLYNRKFVEDSVNEKRAIQVTMSAACVLN